MTESRRSLHARRLAVCAVLVVPACGSTPCGGVPVVPALRETPPVGASGDAADDVAIWVAPDPAGSRVVATQKQGALIVYDLRGAIVQEIRGGRPNNVDLRDAFPWSDGAGPIVAVSDRSQGEVTLWRLDPATGRLETEPRARLATGWQDVYGVCLGRRGDELVVLATSHEGAVKLWRVGADALDAELLGRFALSSTAEGCAIDDRAGVAYVAEETVGLWRFSLARPDGAERRLVDRVGDGRLVADLEGVALWDGGQGRGFVVVSVQGSSRFAVYERGGGNAYRGAFCIGPSPDGSVDGVSGTDGIDVTSAALGPDLSRGLLVAQDDENAAPRAAQDFKYVSWSDVEAALGLAP